MRFFRLLRIILIAYRFGLDEILFDQIRLRIFKVFSLLLPFRSQLKQPRAVRLRLALEALGPIFIKFGQMLSTRRDLLALDFAEELALLQDRVPLSLRNRRSAYWKPSMANRFMRFFSSLISRRPPAHRSPRYTLLYYRMAHRQPLKS